MSFLNGILDTQNGTEVVLEKSAKVSVSITGWFLGRNNSVYPPTSLVSYTDLHIDKGQSLQVDGSFFNHGSIEAVNGGFIVLDTSWISDGDILVDGKSTVYIGILAQKHGTCELDGTVYGDVTLDGGFLKGNGAYSGHFKNYGGVFRGNDFSLNGEYTQKSRGTLQEDLVATDNGPYNHLYVYNANAELVGTLKLEFVNGFTPKIGDSFTVISYASHSGEFDNIVCPDGYKFRIAYGPTDAIVTAYAVP